MGGCCVSGCSNSSTKKYLMKVIPRDPERRQKWIKNIGRKNWIPSQHASVCEVHFEKNMWEKTREDGTRVLKKIAVPTIFPNQSSSDLTGEKVEKNHFNKNSLNNIDSELQKQFLNNKITFDEQIQEQNKILKEIENIFCSNEINVNSIKPLVLNINRNLVTLNDKERLENADRIISKQQKLIHHYIKTNQQLRKTNQLLSSHHYQKILENLFNNDQIQHLRIKMNNGSRVRNWTNETIKDAQHLKSVCGTKGYEELLRRGLPYPSLRRLRKRRVEST